MQNYMTLAFFFFFLKHTELVWFEWKKIINLNPEHLNVSWLLYDSHVHLQCHVIVQ